MCVEVQRAAYRGCACLFLLCVHLPKCTGISRYKSRQQEYLRILACCCEHLRAPSSLEWDSPPRAPALKALAACSSPLPHAEC